MSFRGPLLIGKSRADNEWEKEMGSGLKKITSGWISTWAMVGTALYIVWDLNVGNGGHCTVHSMGFEPGKWWALHCT